MKHIIYLSFLLAASLAAGTAPSDDAKMLEGTWLPRTAELGGRPLGDAVLKSISLKLDGGKYEVFVGNSPDRGTYTLDPTTNPRSISVTGTDGPNKGKTFPAIYQLGHDDDGDTLRICYDLSGKRRPTEFKSVVGTKLYLVNYSRKKE